MSVSRGDDQRLKSIDFALKRPSLVSLRVELTDGRSHGFEPRDLVTQRVIARLVACDRLRTMIGRRSKAHRSAVPSFDRVTNDCLGLAQADARSRKFVGNHSDR